MYYIYTQRHLLFLFSNISESFTRLTENLKM